MTFEEWFYESEGFSERWERLYSDLETSPNYTEMRQRMTKWLEAAYGIGYKSGYYQGEEDWRTY